MDDYHLESQPYSGAISTQNNLQKGRNGLLIDSMCLSGVRLLAPVSFRLPEHISVVDSAKHFMQLLD